MILKGSVFPINSVGILISFEIQDTVVKLPDSNQGSCRALCLQKRGA